jgi:uncharacterized protein
LSKVKRFFKPFIITGITLVILWAGITLFLYFFQNQVLYSPQTLSVFTINRIKHSIPNAEEVFVQSHGIKLHGWLVKNNPTRQAPLIIYFGGQGDEISSMVEASWRFEGCNFLALNYRGFGLSQGQPFEKSIFDDSLAIYDYVAGRNDLGHEKIIVMGRSLGSGVAVYLARNRKVQAVILISPYDSITSVAQEKFPLIPVELINKNRYDSISRAVAINDPVLAIIGDGDITVPPWHSMKLLEKWRGEKTVKMIQGKGHNDIVGCEEYWITINDYLKKQVFF